MKSHISFQTEFELKKRAEKVKNASGFQLRKVYELAFIEGLLILEKTYKTKL